MTLIIIKQQIDVRPLTFLFGIDCIETKFSPRGYTSQIESNSVIRITTHILNSEIGMGNLISHCIWKITIQEILRWTNINITIRRAILLIYCSQSNSGLLLITFRRFSLR